MQTTAPEGTRGRTFGLDWFWTRLVPFMENAMFLSRHSLWETVVYVVSVLFKCDKVSAVIVYACYLSSFFVRN